MAQAREEIAPSLGRHVEQAPQRIDEVAGAVVLAGILGRVGHFARPMMPDGIAVLAEDVEDRLVPILAFAHAALGTFRPRQPARVAVIIGRIVAPSIGRGAWWERVG